MFFPHYIPLPRPIVVLNKYLPNESSTSYSTIYMVNVTPNFKFLKVFPPETGRTFIIKTQILLTPWITFTNNLRPWYLCLQCSSSSLCLTGSISSFRFLLKYVSLGKAVSNHSNHNKIACSSFGSFYPVTLLYFPHSAHHAQLSLSVYLFAHHKLRFLASEENNN